MILNESILKILDFSKKEQQFKLFDILNNFKEKNDELFKSTTNIEIKEVNKIPANPNDIPFKNQNEWLKVKNVTALFIDMSNSSILDYKNYAPRVAQIYQGFTNTLVQTMALFKASYYDIKGDGAFALFDSKNSSIYALLCAVTFKTFFLNILKKKILEVTNNKIELRFRGGIFFGDVIFKRMGVWGDKKNEVWIGSTVNNCVKLASKANIDTILVSKEVYDNFKESKFIIKSCGCKNGKYTGEKEYIWDTRVDLGLEDIGIEVGYELQSPGWCPKHGELYLNSIIEEFKLDLL